MLRALIYYAPTIITKSKYYLFTFREIFIGKIYRKEVTSNFFVKTDTTIGAEG